MNKNSIINTKPSEESYINIPRGIIDRINSPKNLKFQSNQNIDILKQKALILGYGVKEICKNLISIETNTDKIIISHKQIRLQSAKSAPLFKFTHFTSIDCRNTDTSHITDMTEMFWCCEAKSLDLSSFDTSNVTNMSWMFFNCKAQSLDLSSFDTSNVTDMSWMFERCYAKYIGLSSFNTSKVEDMREMFKDCRAQVKLKDTKILEEYYRKDTYK